MPKYKIYDNATGRSLTLEGTSPPTEQESTELFAQFHGVPKALEPPPADVPNAIPGMGQVPSQEGRGGVPAFAAPSTPAAPKAPGFRDVIAPVTDKLNQPISSYLPQGVQDFLSKRSITDTGVGTPKVNYPAEFAKGVAEKINPGQILALIGTLSGGLPGVAANAALGAGGAMEATDPTKSPADRIMGGANAAAGLVGVIPHLGSLKGITSPSPSTIPKSTIRTVEELKAAAMAAKSPEELTGIKRELQLVDFQDKLLKNKVGPESTRLKDLRDANATQHQYYTGEEAATTAANVGAAEAQAARKATQSKASGTLGHFGALDPEQAAKEAKILQLAKSQQNLDELAQIAGQARPEMSSSQVEYFTPKSSDVAPTAMPAATGTSAQESEKAIGEARAMAQQKPQPPPTPQTIDDVMFGPITKPRIRVPAAGEFVKPRIRAVANGAETPTPSLTMADKLENLSSDLAAGSPKNIAMKAKATAAYDAATAPKQGMGNSFIVPPGIETPKPTHMDAMMKKAPKGVSETMAAKPKAAPKPTTPAEDLAERLGTPAEAKVKPARTEDVLRSNPRFQALSKEERAKRYRELGGVDAELRKSPLNQSDPTTSGIDPSKLYSGLDPNLIGAALRSPAARAVLGGAAGYAASDEHPLLMTGAGAAGGLIAAPAKYGGMNKALETLNAIRYESLLAGAPQITNFLGNTGAAIASPFLEAARGNIGGAKGLVKYFMHPGQVAADVASGAKEGWNSAEKITRFGKEVEAIGPSGKALRAVDQGTKRALGAGGLSKDLAGHYTLSAEPSTDTGKILVKAQSQIPGASLIAPFMRTAVKGVEMGAALSPMRLAPGLGKNLRNMVPAQEFVTAGGHKIPKAVFEGLLSMLAPAAGVAGATGYGPTSTMGTAALGPLAAPYAMGRGIRDYAKYGRDDPRDVAESVANNLPLIGDIPKTVSDPGKILGELPSQFLPQFLQVIGDRAVRDTKSDSEGYLKQTMDQAENGIRAKIPGLRETLPAKRTFLGDLKVRTLIGQYPQDDYDTDPTAKRISEAGALRRAPNQSLGGESLKDKFVDTELKAALKDKPELLKLVDTMTSRGNSSTTPMEESRLGELRGKATRQFLEPTLQQEWFKALPKDKQDVIIKMLISKASETGSDYFKMERKANAAKGLK